MTEEVPRVLVVDDDDGLREILCEFLQDAGYGVAAASNGAQALDYLRNEPAPCLILLDLMMPVMDGWEFREAQLQDSKLADIPVVVVTAVGPGESSPVDQERTLRKPVSPAKLLETVASFCSPRV